MKKYCIDLGGTNIRLALIEEKKILKKESFSTNSQDPKENINQILNFYKENDLDVDNVYICCPGPLNEKGDMIVESPNLPGWNNYDFKKEIEEALKVSLHIVNDANAATLGEALIHENYKNVVYFTISTGFGGGFCINKNIYDGEYNTAFEIKDYIVELPKDLKYDNLFGLEDLTSGTGIYKLAKINGLEVQSAKEVFELYKQNDEVAVKIYNYCKDTIAKFLKNTIYMLNPGIIVMGGSVVLKNEEFFEDIKKVVYKDDENLIKKTDIKLAHKSGDSGLLGLTLI